jgi:galactonate dehydratase
MGMAMAATCFPAFGARPKLKLTRLELLPVRATERTVWLFVRLHTDAGLEGLGEASDAFGFSNTSKADVQKIEAQLRTYFDLIAGGPPFEIERYRSRARALAGKGGVMLATAFSAIEQAMWDLAGKALGVPVYTLLGGAIHETLPVYANINRTTKPRTPQGFAGTARKAVAEGFRAVKAAPFDGFPRKGSAEEVRQAVELGIACTKAIREAVGPEVQVLIDCHSNFTVEMSKEVARRLDGENLGWYEEPVAPVRVAETKEIKRAIRQPVAGGEMLFGVEGFLPLCREQAVDVIMPDVKHCGGVLEMKHIAAMAAAHGVMVAPHNPAGPVSTAASVQICAGMKNFQILELQWGEVDWRGDLVEPRETFEGGRIRVPDGAGFGVKMNEALVRSKLD